jgi:hypothetical protein
MDSVHDILAALPAIKPSTKSAIKAYDTSIKQHLIT